MELDWTREDWTGTSKLAGSVDIVSGGTHGVTFQVLIVSVSDQCLTSGGIVSCLSASRRQAGKLSLGLPALSFFRLLNLDLNQLWASTRERGTERFRERGGQERREEREREREEDGPSEAPHLLRLQAGLPQPGLCLVSALPQDPHVLLQPLHMQRKRDKVRD
ncbi:hypothetical protein JZ751_001918 [Albula glossodonta]|uniref:Uncharacterized protein n=1 Tax=Albula glossodonta TaxID=121402 RepID=A0A8T2P406_9TELE|nr:hypothetical protein JZ751_001918 [Albula glossodonta]